MREEKIMLNFIQMKVSREDLVSVALGKKDADLVITSTFGSWRAFGMLRN